MNTQKLPLSVIVHTKNSQETLKQCLQSVDFAEEIIVIDMESADETKKMAEKFTQNIFTVKDVGYVEPVRNFGIDKATREWVLIVDADEEVSEGLEDWLTHFFNNREAEKATVFWIPRRNFMFGQEIKHTGWWPDHQLRFFQKGAVRWSEKIHSAPEITGQVKKLPANPNLALIHQNYSSVEQFVDRMNRYTSITVNEGSKELQSKNLISRFSNEFFRRTFQHEGIKDGELGVAMAILQSSYELLIGLKSWEKEKFKGRTESSRQTFIELKKFSRELNYWVADWQVKHTSGLNRIWWMLIRKRNS